MAQKSNAVWIGAIVIVAVLTVIELISLRENGHTADKTNNKTLTGSSATSASPLQDAGQVDMESTKTTETSEQYSVMTDRPEPDTRSEPEAVPDENADFDGQQTDIAANTGNPLNKKTEADLDEMAETANRQTHSMNSNTDAAAEETLARVEIDGVTPAPPTEDQFADTPPLSEGREEKSPTQPADQSTIKEHLAAAQAAFDKLRMTTPAGDNAYDHYQTVLAMDPDNAEAHAGIQEIVDMYIYLIYKAIAEGQLTTARKYLLRAENIQPDSPELKNLRTKTD